MVIINSKNDKECNLLINNSIKNILNNEEKYAVLLIDELYEFINLVDELKGKRIFSNFLTNPNIETAVEQNKRFYAIHIDYPIEYSLNEIKKIEDKIKSYGYEPLTIFKSTNNVDIEFIRSNYDKNNDEKLPEEYNC